jgi:hypothetical protein
MSGISLDSFDRFVQENPADPFVQYIKDTSGPLFYVQVDFAKTDVEEDTVAGLKEILEEPAVAKVLKDSGNTTVTAQHLPDGQTRLSLPVQSSQDAKKILDLVQQHNKKRGKVKNNNFSVSLDLNLVRIPEPPFNGTVFELPATEGRELRESTVGTVAYSSLRDEPSIDIRDTTLGFDWLFQVIAKIPKAEIPFRNVGIMDTGVAVKHHFFSDVGIVKRFDCSNGIECIYTAGGDPEGDFVGHGTHVAGIVTTGTEVDALIDLPVFLKHTRAHTMHAIYKALLKVEEQLQKLSSDQKPYAYLINTSISYLKLPSEGIPGVLSKERAAQHNALSDQITGLIDKLHRNYPRFKLIAASGNNRDKVDPYLPAAHKGVRAVADYSARNYVDYTIGNYGTPVRISHPGIDVLSASHTGPRALVRASGTSMAAPSETAMLMCLMTIFPKLSVDRIIKIIDDLAIGLDQIPKSYYTKGAPVRAPVANLDLKRFMIYLNNNPDLKSSVNPHALTEMYELEKSYQLDNIPNSAPDVTASIPNYSARKVRFNVGDSVVFKITATAPIRSSNDAFSFVLSSTYIPPVGALTIYNADDNSGDLIRLDQGYYTQPVTVPLPNDGQQHTYTVTVLRKKIRDDSVYPGYIGLIAEVTVVNEQGKVIVNKKAINEVRPFGSQSTLVADAMLGVGKSPAVTVTSLSQLQNVGNVSPSTPPSAPPSKAPTTRRATAAPTRRATAAPTDRKTSSPTVPRLPANRLASDDCQLLVYTPPIDKQKLVFQVNNRKIIIDANSVQVVGDHNNEPIRGVRKNSEVLAHLDPGKRYLFMLKNSGDEFSIMYVPMIQKRIKGTNRKRYVADGRLQEFVSWTKQAGTELDISFPGLAANQILGNDIRECDDFTAIGTIRGRRGKGRKLSASIPDGDSAQANSGTSGATIAPGIFAMTSGLLSSSVASLAGGITNYLAKPGNNSESTDYTNPVMDIINRGAPVAAAAMAVLGLGYLVFNRLSTKSNDSNAAEPDDNNAPEPAIRFITVNGSKTEDLLSTIADADLETGMSNSRPKR